MLQFELVSRFPAPHERVIALILDAEYQERMHTGLGFKTWALVESSDDGLTRKLRLDPPSKLPGFIQKAVANKTGYVESQTWQADRTGYTWSVAFDLSPKLSLSGTTRFVEDASGDVCVRTIDFTVEMKARLIGKKVEAVVKDEALKTQRATAQAMAEHLASPAAD